jgi:hypothetical protein
LANFTPRLSLAATWTPVSPEYITATNAGGLAATTYGHVTLGGLSSLVISGWGWGGGFGTDSTLKAPEPVHILILEQQPDGTMKSATAKYLSSDVISGANSVIVADFNGDGKQDIFLPAHNESPFQAMPSTLYTSNAAGTFDKTVLADKVMAHDAELSQASAAPTVFTATFTPGDVNPVYTYSAGAMHEAVPSNLAQVFHQSIAVGNFGARGATAVAMGDVYSNDPSDNAKIKVYAYANGDIASTTPMATITPYLSVKHPDFTSIYGKGITHTYRILSDDFNHDGRIDLVAEESMWVGGGAAYPTALQMLQNGGDWKFLDKTDQLATAFNQASQEIDYQTQLIDLDHSGINSYLMAGVPPGSFANNTLTFDNSRAPNYLLLNDGTGQLHVGLHDQFLALGDQVIQYVKGLLQTDGYKDLYVGQTLQLAGVPKFEGFQTADGALNFVAEVPVGRWVSPGVWGVLNLMVNVPIHYNPTTDYRDAITVADRNGSHLIRTFAGDDVIHSGTGTTPCQVDGGIGMDTVVYAGKRSNFTIQAGAAGFTVTDKTGTEGIDTLVNVERLHFADADVALDINGNAGQAYRIYQAAFNRAPDAVGLGFWIAAMDHGTTLAQVAAGFANSAEFTQLYGANPAAPDLVGHLYQNILHRAPDQGGFDFWVHAFDSGAVKLPDLLAAFSESPENQTALIGTIGAGIAYTPFG